MLVLSRKINEEIVIDNNIRIRVVQVAGGKVRLGIEAPRDVAIHRAELAFQFAAEEPADGELILATGPSTGVALTRRAPR